MFQPGSIPRMRVRLIQHQHGVELTGAGNLHIRRLPKSSSKMSKMVLQSEVSLTASLD
jgi:hypothetical protein